MQVTLSFDNGPEPGVTPRVLDVLGRFGIRATFFVLGAKLADPARRALAARAHAEGHWIGNHTRSHTIPLGNIDDEGLLHDEIVGTQALIGELSHPDRLFRPFGGGGEIGTHLLNGKALEILKREALTCVLWNAIPRDWADPAGWLDTALLQCSSLERSVVVLHDLPTGAMDRLQEFIERALAAGATFRQDFPSDCVPILRGKPVAPLDAYVK